MSPFELVGGSIYGAWAAFLHELRRGCDQAEVLN
jgi:hypothetical protein